MLDRRKGEILNDDRKVKKKRKAPKRLCKLTEESNNNNNFPLRTQLSGLGKVSWQQTLKQ